MTKLPCAVLGATGVVGQYFLALLADHPEFQVQKVCASESRTGRRIADVPRLIDADLSALGDLEFSPLDMVSLADAGIRVVFSALPADVSKQIEPQAAQAGLRVFSNASAFRMAPQVPILIPEVNADQLALVEYQQRDTSGFIVTNANCTTTGLALALLPLRALGIRRVILSSYQAISGAGYPGLSALDISGNVIPYIAGEEEKIALESGKIFGRLNGETICHADWEVQAHCIRVPTRVGHLLSVHVEMEKTVAESQIVQLYEHCEAPLAVQGLATAPHKPVLLTKDPCRPQPLHDVLAGTPARARGMAVMVGRLQVKGNAVRFVALANNLIRGAAGGSVLNAELAHREGRL